jgi:hypothetical protein
MTEARSVQDNTCLQEAFATIPLPAYVAPGARPPMGRHNDRIYEMQQAILQSEIDGLAERAGLAAAMRALYDQQVDIGFIQDDLSQVGYFRYRAASDDARFFIVQFNPCRAERFKGAGRKAPPPGSQVVGVADPSCFLCTDNIRWQHRSVQSYYRFAVNGRPYNVLCNPFPFMRAHLTIASGDHLPQSFHVAGDEQGTRDKILRIVADLYGVIEQLPTFVGLYNGAGAGASIEKHLHYHFFELPDGHGGFPLQRAAALTERKLSGPTACLKIEGYPLAAHRVRGDRDAAVGATVELAAAWDRQAGEAASANIIALWEQGAISVYFIPRNRFYTRSPGLEGMVAGLETLGEFILCTEDEHRAIREQRVNYEYLWRILEAVRPPEG